MNLDGSTSQGIGAVLRWRVVDTLARRRQRAPGTAPIPRVQPDYSRLAQPPGPGQGARATWIGHASWLLQLDGMSILIDPVFADLPAPGPRRNAAPGIPLDRLPAIDAALISHGHFDHCEPSTLERIQAPVLAGLGMSRYFRKPGVMVHELGWWQSFQLGAVRVTFVPAQHWSRRGFFDRNRALWGGFVIEGSSAILYHAGDSAYFPGFVEIGRRFPKITAALLPIGSYSPAWFMEKEHLNPEQAVQAYLDLGARTLLAMHWGTFKLSDEPLDEAPVRLLAESKKRGLPEGGVRVLAIGESLELLP